MARILRIGFLCLLIGEAPVAAPAEGERLSIGGTIAAGFCYSTSTAGDDTCLGLPVQPELSVRSDDQRNELSIKLGFASGGTLDGPVAPWAADLEDDVVEINGRAGDHVLTAWYRHQVGFDGGGTLGVTVGIIDAADYLDDNRYANDEFNQFSNAALVNGPNVFLPSYDKGLALDWRKPRWSMRGVYMNVHENGRGAAFDFLGAQLGLHVGTPLGPGNYRLIVDRTGKDFTDPAGLSRERCSAILLSADQQLDENFGVFVRIGEQDDSPAVDYATLYSGGIELGGRAWGRDGDTVAIGYARLTGGNSGVAGSRIAEGYYRLTAGALLAISANVQYLADDYSGGVGSRRLVVGVRLTLEL